MTSESADLDKLAPPSVRVHAPVWCALDDARSERQRPAGESHGCDSATGLILADRSFLGWDKLKPKLQAINVTSGFKSHPRSRLLLRRLLWMGYTSAREIRFVTAISIGGDDHVYRPFYGEGSFGRKSSPKKPGDSAKVCEPFPHFHQTPQDSPRS
jgi:hypothetical protein